MNRALLLAAALWASSGIPIRAPRPRPKPDPETMRHPCPNCAAKPGERCNPRTLGAHPYHAARARLLEVLGE